ncbi:unnamed protein product [Citrullus colocynthis]|uniref:Cytochrome P450 n=1 Tax=Citrullus colocynthis TaxID=252529 RepID=A0ABP0YED2_9ROSI
MENSNPLPKAGQNRPSLPFVHHDIFCGALPFLLPFRSKSRLAISDSDLIKEVLVDTRGCFRRIQFDPLSKVVSGEGLTALEGEKWVTRRRIANQAFNIKGVKEMGREEWRSLNWTFTKEFTASDQQTLFQELDLEVTLKKESACSVWWNNKHIFSPKQSGAFDNIGFREEFIPYK